MGVVAITAGHFSLPYRVRVRFHRLCALLLVAIETDLSLRDRGEDRIALDMARMAVGAGDRIAVVLTAMPGETVPESEPNLTTGGRSWPRRTRPA
jgi:hypothetical protein